MSSPIEELFPKLAAIIRASSGLAAKDINFYKNIDSNINEKSEEYSKDLLGLINQVVSASGSDASIEKETVKDTWPVLGNLIDNFLERSDIAFDQIKNKTSNKDQDTNQLTYLDDSNSINNGANNNKIEKPQLKFKTKVDNSESHPFKPLLTSKPNAITPFGDVFELQTGENDQIFYKHPYEKEILTEDYNEDILQKSKPIEFQDWEKTDAIWVDNVDTLNKMVKELKKEDVIAIDLEHHDYRSYYGLVCLMQISSRTQDWLVDTLALREDLQVLNQIFTDPQITKVLHGAFMDIIWLQRDLGLYIVSLFDTYHASKSLGFPKHSLAYLLERFASFKTSKKYQLADWRIRPLTKAMRLYARADTHFLLYIYDVLKDMLIDSNKLTQVLYDSRQVALRRFEYSKFKPESTSNLTFTNFDQNDSWRRLMYQYNISTSKANLVEALYNWRDEMAKENDESPRFIMSNQLLASLSSIAPTTAENLLSIPGISSTSISEFVRKNSKVIADLIKEALELSKNEDFNLLDNAMRSYDAENIEDSENLTVERAQNNYNFFQKALKVLEKNQSEAAQFNVEKSQMFVSDMLSNDPSFEERQEIIEHKLNQIANVVHEPKEELIDNEEQKIDLNIGSDEVEIIEEDKKPNMFDTPDEIIVLKKKPESKRPKTDKKNLVKKEQEEAFDYTTAERVIQKAQAKDRKRKKHEEFNPYAKESDGPKPASKKQVIQRGKAVSFVNKKRKK